MASRGRDKAGQSTSSQAGGSSSPSSPAVLEDIKRKMAVAIMQPQSDPNLASLFEMIAMESLAPKTMSARVESHTLYTFFGGDIFNPGHFYLNPTNTWNPFQRMMEELEDFYASQPASAAPPKEYLRLGIDVVVLYGKSWCRAWILQILPDDKYKVFIFDFGAKVNLPRENFRYIERHFSFTKHLPAQGIRCRALLGPGPDASQNVEWTDDDKKRFRAMIYNQTLIVRFLKRSMIQGEYVFDVFLHILDEPTDKISQFHLERALLQEKRGVDFTEDEKKRRGLTRTDNDPKVKWDQFYLPIAHQLPDYSMNLQKSL